MSARIELVNEAGRCLRWSSEFDIRDGLAAWAEMDGWEVETEHVVPGWGRPDLYLGSGNYRVAVEIKTELDTPSKCRKAMQQADTYNKALPEVSAVFLVASGINREAMAPYEAAYSLVSVQTVDQFFQTLGGWLRGYDDRHRLALRRFQAAAELLEVRRRALVDLGNYAESPTRPFVGRPKPVDPFPLLDEFGAFLSGDEQ